MEPAATARLTPANRAGRAGLDEQPGRGRKKALTDAREEQLKVRLRAGATPADGVCTLRGEDEHRILREEFSVVRRFQANYNLLHKLGFSFLQLQPRPPTHWLKRAAETGWLRRLPIRHRDNLALFLPDGMWADNCTDNAFMESCSGTLKTEMAIAEYDGEANERRAVREYLDYYRFDRKHSSLDYLTSTQFTRLDRPRS